jgi:hypothetical protein
MSNHPSPPPRPCSEGYGYKDDDSSTLYEDEFEREDEDWECCPNCWPRRIEREYDDLYGGYPGAWADMALLWLYWVWFKDSGEMWEGELWGVKGSDSKAMNALKFISRITWKWGPDFACIL